MGEQSFVIRVWGQVQGWDFAISPASGRCNWFAGPCLQPEDGSVEILISGPAQGVQMMLGWLEHGPRTARVTRMEYEEALPPTGQGFHTN